MATKIKKPKIQMIKLSRIGATIPIKKGALRAQLGAKTKKGPRGGIVKAPIPLATINKRLATLKKKAAGPKKLSPMELTLFKRLNLAKTMRKWRKVGRKK